MSKTDISLSHYEAVVRANRMREGENWPSYVERVCVIAGGIQPGEGFLSKGTQWFDWKQMPAPGEPPPPELPYRYNASGVRLPYPEDSE